MRKTIISNFNTSLGIVFLGLVGSIIMARTLGPENRGNIAAAVLWPTLLLYMGSFGTYQAVIYYYAKKRDDSIMWGSCLVATICNSVISILVGYFLISFLLGKASAGVRMYSILVLLSLPFSILSQFVTAILQAKLKFRQFNALRFFFPIAYFICVVALYFLHQLTFTSVLLVQVVLNVVTCFISVFFYGRFVGNILRARYNLRVIKVLYKYGVQVWAGDLSQGLNMRVDQILISNFFSTRQLGFYVVAQSLANFTTILANSFKTILLPIVSKSPVIREKLEIIRSTMHKFNLINAVIIVGSIAVVPVLIVWVYGPAYQQSEFLAMLLLAGFFFLNIKTVMTAALQGLGYPFYVSQSDFAGLVILMCLIYPLSIWYGINGASVAIGISYMAQFVVIHTLYKRIESKTLQ